MYLYQKNNEFFAQISDGLQELGKQELLELGATKIKKVYRGIYFSANKSILYSICYSTKFFTRLLAPIISFKCFHTDKLYKKVKSVNWEDFLSTDNTFAVFSNVSNSRIKHSKYALLRVKDAVADYFVEKFKKRPNVNSKNPDIWLYLYINNNNATISIDLIGGSIHKRGYRKQLVEAPMQENLAAAIIKLSGWNGEIPIYDPMCGSGTLLSEALMAYCKIPSMYLRDKFGFEQLPDYDKNSWNIIKNKLDKQIRPLPKGLIMGSDISEKAIKVAKYNNNFLPYNKNINYYVKDFEKIISLKNMVIVCNPPYGIRMKSKKYDMEIFYKKFGDFLKQKCKSSKAYIYFGKREYIKK